MQPSSIIPIVTTPGFTADLELWSMPSVNLSCPFTQDMHHLSPLTFTGILNRDSGKVAFLLQQTSSILSAEKPNRHAVPAKTRKGKMKPCRLAVLAVKLCWVLTDYFEGITGVLADPAFAAICRTASATLPQKSNWIQWKINNESLGHYHASVRGEINLAISSRKTCDYTLSSGGNMPAVLTRSEGGKHWKGWAAQRKLTTRPESQWEKKGLTITFMTERDEEETVLPYALPTVAS